MPTMNCAARQALGLSLRLPRAVVRCSQGVASQSAAYGEVALLECPGGSCVAALERCLRRALGVDLRKRQATVALEGILLGNTLDVGGHQILNPTYRDGEILCPRRNG
jgi:hypothetical protein